MHRSAGIPISRIQYLSPVDCSPTSRRGRMKRPSGAIRPNSTTTLDPTREISVGITGVSGCGVDGSSAGPAVNADRSTPSPMTPSDASVNDPPTPCPFAQGANARSTTNVLPNRVREERIGHPSSHRMPRQATVMPESQTRPSAARTACRCPDRYAAASPTPERGRVALGGNVSAQRFTPRAGFDRACGTAQASRKESGASCSTLPGLPHAEQPR